LHVLIALAPNKIISRHSALDVQMRRTVGLMTREAFFAHGSSTVAASCKELTPACRKGILVNAAERMDPSL